MVRCRAPLVERLCAIVVVAAMECFGGFLVNPLVLYNFVFSWLHPCKTLMFLIISLSDLQKSIDNCHKVAKIAIRKRDIHVLRTLYPQF